jgi:hypothetical protein
LVAVQFQLMVENPKGNSAKYTGADGRAIMLKFKDAQIAAQFIGQCSGGGSGVGGMLGGGGGGGMGGGVVGGGFPGGGLGGFNVPPPGQAANPYGTSTAAADGGGMWGTTTAPPPPPPAISQFGTPDGSTLGGIGTGGGGGWNQPATTAANTFALPADASTANLFPPTNVLGPTPGVQPTNLFTAASGALASVGGGDSLVGGQPATGGFGFDLGGKPAGGGAGGAPPQPSPPTAPVNCNVYTFHNGGWVPAFKKVQIGVEGGTMVARENGQPVIQEPLASLKIAIKSEPKAGGTISTFAAPCWC